MPLTKGCTPASLRKNIAKLRREGYPGRQAVAIAFNVQRRACSCRAARGPRGGRVLRCKPRRRR
jgi:hypothetical protein